MVIFIIVGCLLIGIIFTGLSMYRFVKEIKEKDSKKDKWTVVAQNILELFCDPLHGAPFYFLIGALFLVVGLLLLSMGMGWGWVEID
ncbi:hypothetical protein [Bacillus cereus group sp. BfR-BA-01379]|uniref:hypothetical protein n=1 Tax=Bacillus cereus group sp. BfR-BA-01379 TaxID=2920323 RepID=UPI001F56655D|nr:hypothetical protein [Bacillus cereus group sp. BfR-BA-01379]